MLASELIYNVKNLKAGGKSSDDSQISDYQWMFIIDQYRSQLIRQQQSKGQSINEQLLQSLNPSKITLTQSLTDKCELITNEIPSFIEGQKSNYSTFVGTEGGLSYQRTTWNKVMWDKQSPAKTFKRWYEVGNKLTVRNHNKSQKLLIMGLFERPMDVVEFNGELDEMNPFNFKYPISNVMLDTLYKMIIESEVKLSLILQPDVLNNGKEDIRPA